VSTAYADRPSDQPFEDADRTEPEELRFDRDTLVEGRRRVFWFAANAGLGQRRSSDLVVAVNELLTNSVRHGGGSGVLRLWREDGSVNCEVRDRGRLLDPRAGRRQPMPNQVGGRGLWIVRRLCDRVEIRALKSGTAARVSMRRS
jgi:anti-sigma regulatory factor (Ser/Thr protein kinase)